MEEEEKKNDLLSPLSSIENLIIITKGGAQPILLDKYDEYLNMPLKLVKMSDIVNYLDIIEKYHSHYPDKKNILNSYLKLDKIILGFSDYLSDFGSNDQDSYLINSTTGKVKITLSEYIKYLFIMNPQYNIVPFEYVPCDSGKKRIQRFISKLNIFFENIESNQNFKECNIIIPYFLDFSKILEQNSKYQSHLDKAKGLLIFNEALQNINNQKVIEYKEQIDKIKKDKKIIIKTSSESIIDLIIGTMIGCTHFEISFPYLHAEEGKCLNFNVDEYKQDVNYGDINKLDNFDFIPNLLDVKDIKCLNDIEIITKDCKCFSCLTGYKRSYLYHLFFCKELNGPIIIAIHNYFKVREFYQKLTLLKNDVDKLNNFIMWFFTTQCTKNPKK